MVPIRFMGFRHRATTRRNHWPKINDWWEVLWSTGYRSLLEQLSDTDLAKFRIKHNAQVNELKTKDGIWMDVETHFSTATRPDN